MRALVGPRDRTELERLGKGAVLWQRERHPRIFGDQRALPESGDAVCRTVRNGRDYFAADDDREKLSGQRRTGLPLFSSP
jgi:hypothetical protein